MKQKIITIFLLIIFIFISFAPVSLCNVNTSSVKVGAESAILIDSNTGKILYGKNEETKKFPASTTKIMTAILAIENCNLDDVVTVEYEPISLVPSGYSVAELQVGEKLTIEQLLQTLLIMSANDSANILAYHISGSIDKFAILMNNKAKELGCTNTNFTNPSGQHNDNHYTTAHDLAKIMQYCTKNSTFRKISGTTSCVIPATNKYEQRAFTNTNELLIKATRTDDSNYYYQYTIAGKTGYTAQAKNCLVSCSNKDGFQLICVVLGAGQDYRGLSYRFLDSKDLFEYGYNTYTVKKIRKSGAIASQIEINKATKDTKCLDLIILDDITAILKQSEMNNDIQPTITLKDNLQAPINKDDILGTITYSIDGIDYTSNLKASHDVELKTSTNIIFNVIVVLIIAFILYKIYAISKKDKNINKDITEGSSKNEDTAQINDDTEIPDNTDNQITDNTQNNNSKNK